MPSDKFNRDMDDYIRSRRQRKSGDTSASKRDEDKGISISYDGPGFWEKFLSLFETVEDERERQPPSNELSSREMKKLERTIEKDKTERDEPNVMVEDEKGELQAPSPSFIDKLMGFMGFGEPSPEEELVDEFDPDDFAVDESERVMYEEDVKEVMKIAHSWIEKLPDKTKKEFKESADFIRYRDLLDKLGLLAKKDKVDLDEDL